MKHVGKNAQFPWNYEKTLSFSKFYNEAVKSWNGRKKAQFGYLDRKYSRF